jgi:hydrogenase-4 component E
MDLLQNPEFGDKVVTLVAAFVLVLQIAMVAQRWLVTNIRLFGAQSFLLAVIAGAIGWYNHAPHMYVAAGLTIAVKAILVPILLERLVDRVNIRHEIEPIINGPLSIVISGALTLIAYIVGESFYQREAHAAGLGHNTLAVAISVFLIGFFMMLNRRKALSQVLAMLTLENGVFLSAICLTYGMPLVVEVGVFFDVLVAVMVLGILVFQIRESFESMDVSKLRRLKG